MTKTLLSQREISALRSVQRKVHQWALNMGWHLQRRELGTLIALCHSELSEALEGGRKDLDDTHLPHRKSLEVELADCVIRILDLCGLMGLDLAGALAEKHSYNHRRRDHRLDVRMASGGKKF